MKHRTLRGLAAVAAATALALGVTACTANGGGGDDAAKTLVFGANLSQEQVWDPHVAALGLENMTNLATYDTLVTYQGGDLINLVPSLATEWSADDSGLSFTFTLDPEATFNSGNPVTSEDVAFSFMRLKHLGSPVSYLAEPIESVETPDASTVVVTIASPNAAFLRLLADPHFVVMEAAVVREQGGSDAEDAAETDTASEWLTENSAGSGPYQIDSAVAGDQLVLVANPEAWRPAEYFERVIVQNTAAHSAQAAAVQQGDIDITQVIAPAIIASIPSNGDVSAYGSPGMTWYFAGMTRNAALNPAIADEDVQRAVRLALDWEGIRAMGPELAPWYGMIPEYLPGGVTEDQSVAQDVDEAKAILEEAGYGDGFQVELCTSTSTAHQPTMLDYAQKVQADLAEVGIEVQINAQEGSAFLTRYRAGECAMVLTVDGPALDDPSHLANFLPDGPRGTRFGWVAGNLGSDGQRYLELAEQAQIETDEEVRAQLWNEIAAGIAQSGLYLPIGSVAFQFLAGNDIAGLDEWANSRTLFDPAHLSRQDG